MPIFTQRERWYFIVRAALSLIVLLVSLIVILNGSYSDATTKWAIGMIGLVVGYWLK